MARDTGGRGEKVSFEIKIRLLEKENLWLEEDIEKKQEQIKVNRKSITWFKNRL